jgi:hypothetical protein
MTHRREANVLDEYDRDLESSIAGVLEHLEIINIALFRMGENLARKRTWR